MPFKKGHKLAIGGARENAGRKPDWFKDKCHKLIQDKKLVDFVSEVAEGKSFSQPGQFGTIIAPPTIKDRLRAFEILADRAFGKPKESVDMNLNVNPFEVLEQNRRYANAHAES